MVNPDVNSKFNFIKPSESAQRKTPEQPKSGKDFKRVMDKSSENENKKKVTGKEGEEDAELENGVSKTEKKPKSIFDMKRDVKELEGGKAKLAIEKKEEIKKLPVQKEETNTAFGNPLMTSVQGSSEASIHSGPAVQATSNVSDIMNSLVNEVTEVITTDRTDTTITIKNAGVFNDAQLTVTSYASAKGEYNITFQNLSPDAKALIDNNQKSLKAALDEKGYAVHIITTSEKIESTTTVNTQQTGDDRGQGQDRGGGSRQDRDERNREER